MQPDDEHCTILALKAEISQMKVRSKNKRQHDHSGGRQPRSSSGISWKDIPPKEGEPKKKKFQRQDLLLVLQTQAMDHS